ncbi:hypothetical protein NGI08_23430 [Klebsiella michiganensis]|uniref:hypothetical protein n=1 Tax=Klebsiella/Raoultella group TaxID=2890311 RepID=UPI0012B8C485|nr:MULTISPECIES: hypothetical protein [Klebsiella/Raoultella group]MBZ7757039.1 hypothetical protein [Raoultella ornithinolytica]MCF6690002.1 hypothetical protein [Raoultella terrigena]MEB8081733.1 hypothetical protein [Klebsiella michiganensis]
MAVIKTHTGIVITKDGEVKKELHETQSMWVVNKTECYRKDTGKRHFGERTRRQLILDSIEPINGSQN